MKLNYLIKRIYMIFIFLHFFSYLLIKIIPAEAKTPNTAFSFFINTVFFVLVFSISILIYLSYPKKMSHNEELFKSMSQKQLLFNVNVITYGSIIGLLLLIYDRVFIRGIDYSQGFRTARYSWLNSTGGSIPSMIGNLLTPLGFLGMFFYIIHNKALSKKRARKLLISTVASVIGHATLNGGRSNILVGLVFMLITLTMNTKKYNFSIHKKKYLRIIPVIFIVTYYISIITLSSAQLGNLDIKDLAALGIQSLYGSLKSNFYKIGEFGNLGYMLTYFIVYLFHGQWTAEIAYSLINRTGNYTFYAISVYLTQLGLIDEPLQQGYFSEIGAFISLPGAFYYDFGYFGLVALSVLCGVLVGLTCLVLKNKKRLNGIELSFVYLTLFMIYMAPILPAIGLSSVIFTIFEFFALGIVNRIIFKDKSNWLMKLEDSD